MKIRIALLSIMTVVIFSSSFGQVKDSLSKKLDSTKLILGKWQLDIMRDSTGSAIDFGTSPNSEPDVFSNLVFSNNKKVLLSVGSIKRDGSWEVSDKKLIIHIKNKTSTLLYSIVSISSSEFELENQDILDNGNIFRYYIIYKRLK